MALVLFHGPRGGIGTTFLLAQTAQALAAAGHEVTALDFAAQGTLHLHFGHNPEHALPRFDGPHTAEAIAHGVALFRAADLARDGDLAEALASGDLRLDGHGGAAGITLADIPAGAGWLRDVLRPFAALEICPLAVTAECLAALPGLIAGQREGTHYVLSMVDDTRRFGRHAGAFVRELLGERLLSAVRRDEAVVEAVAMLQPLSRYAPSSSALQDAATLSASMAALLAPVLAAAAARPDHGYDAPVIPASRTRSATA